jgi:hypothetical protein
MTDSLTAARAIIREAAEAADLPASQRLDRLAALKRDLEEALTEVAEAMADAEAEAAPDDLDVGMAVLALRSRASTTAELVTAGQMTEAQLAESGVLTHDDLDAMDEEGLLEAAAEEMLRAGKLVLRNDSGDWELFAAPADESENE